MSKVKSGMENEIKPGFLLVYCMYAIRASSLAELGQEISSKHSKT